MSWGRRTGSLLRNIRDFTIMNYLVLCKHCGSLLFKAAEMAISLIKIQIKCGNCKKVLLPSEVVVKRLIWDTQKEEV